MGDRRTEGAVFGALGIHVNPLVITGRVGKQIDPILRHIQPIGVAEVLAREARGKRANTGNSLNVALDSDER